MNLLDKIATGMIGTSVMIFQTQSAIAQSPPEIENTSRKITVEIVSTSIINNSNNVPSGSGVLVRKNGNTYSVLTNNHVVRTDENYEVIPYNEDLILEPEHKPIEYINIKKSLNPDLALLEFTSQRNYDVAVPGDPTSLKKGETVYAAGFPQREGFRFVPVEITNEQPVAVGQPLTYKQIQADNKVTHGMSGGPILNQQSQLIGINKAFLREEEGDVTGIPLNTILATFPQIREGEPVGTTSNSAISVTPTSEPAIIVNLSPLNEPVRTLYPAFRALW